MKRRTMRLRKGFFKRVLIYYRAWHVDYLDYRIDLWRVPYGGQPIADVRRQERTKT